MNLARLIIIALAVWLAIHTLRRLIKHLSPAEKTESGTPNNPKNMVRCAQCGLHLPETEAITHQGRYYCCEEHRRQDRHPS